jgi:hypothetical protein
MSNPDPTTRPPEAPTPLRDWRPRSARLATAATLVVACLAITALVQSLRDTAVSRLNSQSSAPQSTGVGTAVRGAPRTTGGDSHWLVFFGIGGALMLIGCGIAYVTADPLADRAYAACAWADAARRRRSDLRTRVVASVEAVDTLDAKIAVIVVNASRDIWVAAGWSEADILERMRANPAFTGTWGPSGRPVEPARVTPAEVGEALGVHLPAASELPPGDDERAASRRLVPLAAHDIPRTNGTPVRA